LEELKLDEAHAEAIVELGIKYGAYSEEMPKAKKAKVEAAQEILAFCVDAWVNDGVTPDDKDDDVAESGRQIVEIFEIAGVEIDDDGNVEYGEPADLESEDEDDDNGDDDEAPFDPDDFIEGYTEMSVSAKVKAIKELDPDDDEDVATLEALMDWENEQDKPSARVLNYIEETLEVEDESEAEAEEEEAEDEDEGEEPWEGYDSLSAVQIKKILSDQLEDEEAPLTAEQVEYVLDYEKGREKPPPRKRVIEFCEELLKQFEEGEAEAESEEEKPKKGLAATRAKRGRAKKTEEPAVSNGVIVLTREQILAALADGSVEIEV